MTRRPSPVWGRDLSSHDKSGPQTLGKMAAVLLTLLFAGTACSDDDPRGDSGRRSAAVSTTVAAASSTSWPASSPAEPVATDLADGQHFGFLKSVDAGGRTIGIDIAQWLTGAAANTAYAEETGDNSGAPNDYFIKNVNPRLRTLKDAEITVQNIAPPRYPQVDATDVASNLRDLARFVADTDASPRFLAWVTLRGGVVVELHEQYVP